MRNTEEETTRRSRQTSDTTSTGVEVQPDRIGQIAEEFKGVDGSWLDTLGDWLRSIGDALGDISFD